MWGEMCAGVDGEVHQDALLQSTASSRQQLILRRQRVEISTALSSRSANALNRRERAISGGVLIAYRYCNPTEQRLQYLYRNLWRRAHDVDAGAIGLRDVKREDAEEIGR